MTALAQNDYLEDTIQHWKHISPIIHEPQTDDEYDQLASMLDRLLDIVGDDETHELMGLVDVMSHMISMYDDAHEEQSTEGRGIDALKFLMEQRAV